VEIVRVAVRGHTTESLEPSDAEEVGKTRYILKAPVAEILGCCARALFSHPGLFLATLVCAFKLGLRRDGDTFRQLAYFAEACVLKIWLRKDGVTHVHAHFGTNAAAVAMFCKGLGGPTYSFTVHGPDEFDRPLGLALREKVQNAEFVATISSFCRSQLYRWSRFSDWDKIHVVRCALDVSYFVAEGPAITERPKLLCVGRLSEEKGQMLIVRAARTLVERGIEIEVVLAGDGPLREAIESEIRRCGLETVVRIAGWVDNERVRALLAEARALVVASFAEGLPVVIMEAFAMNRPVLSTHIAGIPELVENEVSGWLFAPGDIGQLADAMHEAVRAEPIRLAEMGKKGKKRTLERHLASVEAGKLRELFAATFRCLGA
jgi:glycosyltransferase involved in cell wall biosynthesis